MSLPSVESVGKAVVMTAIALVVLHFVKPLLPQSVSQYLS